MVNYAVWESTEHLKKALSNVDVQTILSNNLVGPWYLLTFSRKSQCLESVRTEITLFHYYNRCDDWANNHEGIQVD